MNYANLHQGEAAQLKGPYWKLADTVYWPTYF